jgi:hypothetical protein
MKFNTKLLHKHHKAVLARNLKSVKGAEQIHKEASKEEENTYAF